MHIRDELRAYMQELAKKAGSRTSEKKRIAVRENGKKGGRPKGKMKREPKQGEMMLVHTTTNTGHMAALGVNWKNYDPRSVRVAQRMFQTGEEVGGLSLSEPIADSEFDVLVENDGVGVPITTNQVSIEDNVIMLETRILEAARNCCQEAMEAAADLEQCAALALIFGQRPELAKQVTQSEGK